MGSVSKLQALEREWSIRQFRAERRMNRRIIESMVASLDTDIKNAKLRARRANKKVEELERRRKGTAELLVKLPDLIITANS